MFLGIGTLGAVAGSAEQLQVVQMVGSSFDLGYDMIHHEVSELKQRPASAALAFLLAEQDMLVGPVIGKLAQVRALRNIDALDGSEVAEQVKLSDTNLNQINGLLRYVYAHPIGGAAFRQLRKPWRIQRTGPRQCLPPGSTL